MKKEYSIEGTGLVAEFNDVVVYDYNKRFLFSESNCKNLKQLRELILNSSQLVNILTCNYKGKKYSISEIYSL